LSADVCSGKITDITYADRPIVGLPEITDTGEVTGFQYRPPASPLVRQALREPPALPSRPASRVNGYLSPQLKVAAINGFEDT
jgi:hypothetical protein